MRNIAIEGFSKTLAAALEIHQAYPSLAKHRPKLDYGGEMAKSCIHCYMVGVAEQQVLRTDNKPILDNVMYPWPIPDVIGLTLDPREKATMVIVENGSATEQVGFVPGDEILTLAEQPVTSIADL